MVEDLPSPASRPIGGLGRHVGWTYVQLGSSAGVGLLITAIALRRLGAADYGVFALITALSSYLLLLDLGLGFVVVRDAAREMSPVGEEQRAAARTEIQTAHSAYAHLGAAALLATVAFVLFLPVFLPSAPASEGGEAATVAAVGGGVALMLGTSAMPGLVKGRNGFRILAIAAVVGSATDIALVLLLVAPLGVVALGLGSFGAVVGNRLVLHWWLRRHVPWFRVGPRRLRMAEVRRTVDVAVPLLVLTIGGQVLSTVDLVILSWFASAAVVGLYSLGSSLPTQAVGVLYQGYDVVLPSFSATTDRAVQEEALAFLTRVASYVGAVGLGILGLLRHDVIFLIAGRRSAFAASVLLVFCGIWMVTLGPHGLIILIIARGRERTLMPFVIAEMTINFILTLVAVNVIGPIGAAYATLVTLIVASLVFLPVIVRRELAIPAWRLLVVDGLVPLAVGVAVAAAAWLAVAWLPTYLTRIVAGGAAAGAAGLAVGLALLGKRGRDRLLIVLRTYRGAPAAP